MFNTIPLSFSFYSVRVPAYFEWPFQPDYYNWILPIYGKH